jgi:hypothetical protein
VCAALPAGSYPRHFRAMHHWTPIKFATRRREFRRRREKQKGRWDISRGEGECAGEGGVPRKFHPTLPARSRRISDATGLVNNFRCFCIAIREAALSSLMPTDSPIEPGGVMTRRNIDAEYGRSGVSIFSSPPFLFSRDLSPEP